MLIDRNGDLWTGGSGGVVHWDHATGEYTKYTTENGLASNHVRAIAQSPDGTLWFGTCRGGISQFDGKQWKTYDDFKEKFPNDCVTSIAVAPDGTLWFGSYAKLMHYDGATGIFEQSKEFPLSRIDVLAVAPDGAVWAGEEDRGSLYRYDGKNWQNFDKFLPNRSVSALAFAPDGALWVGTDERGLAQYKNGVWKTILFTTDPTDPNKSDKVSSIAFQADGKVWVSFSIDTSFNIASFEREERMNRQTLSGVRYFNGETWKTIDTQDGLVDNEIMTIKVDQQNNVWFGSYNQGVSRFDGKTWTSFQTNDTLPSNYIQDIDISASGVIWIDYINGVSRYEKSGWKNFLIQGDKAILDTCALHIENDNSVWMSSFDGLAHLENQNWTTYYVPEYQQLEGACQFAVNSKGNLLISTFNDGVLVLDKGSWKPFVAQGNSDGQSAIIVDPDGSVWIGTFSNGIYVYNGQGINTQHYTTKNGLAHNFINSLAIAPDGTIWAATRLGLCFYKDGKWTIYRAKNMPQYEILHIVVDKQGLLWAATDNGLYHFDGKQWLLFTTKDGLADNYVKKIVVGLQGEIWLATKSGVSLYLPNK